MTHTSHGAHEGPYTQLTAAAAGDLRRPIAAAEVRFKVQAVRWTGRGQDKVASAAQVVAYMDARTVIARLNLLFPGAWHAHTEALPLEMRLTRRKASCYSETRSSVGRAPPGSPQARPAAVLRAHRRGRRALHRQARRGAPPRLRAQRCGDLRSRRSGSPRPSATTATNSSPWCCSPPALPRIRSLAHPIRRSRAPDRRPDRAARRTGIGAHRGRVG
jgi:hypothetical protein